MSKIIKPLRRSASLPWIAPGATRILMHSSDKRAATSLSRVMPDADLLIARASREMHDAITYKGTSVPVYMNHSPHLEDRVVALERLGCEILDSTDQAFEFERNDEGQITVLVEYPLAEHFYIFNPNWVAPFENDLGMKLRVRPLAHMTREVLMHHPFVQNRPWFRNSGHMNPIASLVDGDALLGEEFNDFIDTLRAEAVSRRIDKVEIAHDYIADRANDRMWSYVERRAKLCDRVFIVSMVLFHREEYRRKVPVELAMQHHAKFTNRLRALAAVKRCLVGAIWKRDWSEARGHYYRWIFICDGEFVQAEWEWAELIETVWGDVVPQEAGFADMLGHEGNERFTGMINVDQDTGKLARLKAEIRYWAMKDQALCLEPIPNANAWGPFTPGGRIGKIKRSGKPSD